MNYNVLKNAIMDVIKQNGDNDITGEIMQNTLLAIVGILGAQYQFGGIATTNGNPGTPDYNIAYIAGPGRYVNYGDINIPNGSIGILKYNGVWQSQSIEIDGGGGGSTVGSELNVKDYGATGDGTNDDTVAIQNTINAAYNQKKAVRIPNGIYRVTRTLWVYDGTEIRGDGINNTIVQTPFGTNAIAKGYVTRDKNKQYCTLTDPDNVPILDIVNGHNRFYIGGGIVGYYDSDRATNPNHPLYWPNDGSEDWQTWKSELNKIEQRGSWVGLTGRENYGGGVFKSMQIPGLEYPDGYSHVHPYGPIWTGVRNVKFCDFQINTNGIDRGKDSAIDFQYKASAIPSGTLRETYDSSVLNVQLYNMYLFSLGRSGYRGTRCVDHTFIGVYVRQCAAQGFYIDGVTSCFWSGCYTNSCQDGGYVLRGCNYCNLSACASDSCSIGYNIYNCNGVTLTGCGAEATRYQAAGEDETEDPLKGRAFAIQNSDGISLLSCYTMTSHPKVYEDVLEITDEDLNPNWNKSRHVYVSNSKNVQVAYCHFKAFERIRTNAYRNADNEKCNYQGGPYDPTQPGSRYWQVQNYLVGAQYEIRSEDSSVQIIASEKEENLIKLSEIRAGNLDILDPGTVQNPASGFDTAGKTLTGADGNGGWTYTDPDTHEIQKVTMENFEFAFPINAKNQYGTREYFWAWRNSLILVRKHNDTSLQADYPTRYFGYLDVISGTPIDWSQVSSADMSKFSFDIVTDYQSTSFIDGSKSLFTYGRFFWESLTQPIAYAPKIYTPIPAYVKDAPDGHRTAINTNTIAGIPAVLAKAGVMIVGNENKAATEETEEVVAGMVMSVVSKKKNNETDSNTKHTVFSDLTNKDILTIFEKGKVLSTRGHRFISSDDNDYTDIETLLSGASSETIISKINEIITRLRAHGLVFHQSPDSDFGLIQLIGWGDGNSLVVNVSFETDQTDYVMDVYYDTQTHEHFDDYSGHVRMTEIDDNIFQNAIPLSSFGDSGKVYMVFVASKYEELTPGVLTPVTIASSEYFEMAWDYINKTASLNIAQPSFGIPTINSVGISSDANPSHLSVYLDEVIESGGNVTIYKKGIAYSSSNQTPTHAQNYKEFTGDIAELPFSSSATLRYARFYIETSATPSESDRIYSDSYKITLDRVNETATIETL